MEILPGVHSVNLLGCHGYLVSERELTLIDTGLPGSRRRLERYLARIGRSLDELRRIIVTHAHPDHIGAVRELAAATDAQVYLHPADLAELQVTLREAWNQRDRAKLMAYFTRTPHASEPAEDGDVLPVLGGLRIVHTPGHTPGSICLYAPRHRLLFTGDMLQVIRRRVTFASTIFSADISQARASVARLAKLDVETIAFAHYAPWTDDANGVLAALAERAAHMAAAPTAGGPAAGEPH
jgi:glyoxylase-like metal-dependent hydrolase (beta-lactamase superfamily II)